MGQAGSNRENVIERVRVDVDGGSAVADVAAYIDRTFRDLPKDDVDPIQLGDANGNCRIH